MSSRPDAKVQNQHCEPQEPRDLPRSVDGETPLDDDTRGRQRQRKSPVQRCLNDLHTLDLQGTSSSASETCRLEGKSAVLRPCLEKLGTEPVSHSTLSCAGEPSYGTTQPNNMKPKGLLRRPCHPLAKNSINTVTSSLSELCSPVRSWAHATPVVENSSGANPEELTASLQDERNVNDRMPSDELTCRANSLAHQLT